MAKKLTLTEALAENRLEGETLSQCAHRLRYEGETMTDAAHRMQGEDGEGLSLPVFNDPVVAINITDVAARITWDAADGQVDNYQVDVAILGTPIANSPFTMAGGTLGKSLSGLTASTQYEVDVTAINENGNDASTQITFDTLA